MCGSSKEVRNEWSVFYLRIKKFNKKSLTPPLFKKGFFYHFKVCKNNIFEQICTPCIADCCSGSVPPDGSRSRRALHHTHVDEDTRPLKQQLTKQQQLAHRLSVAQLRESTRWVQSRKPSQLGTAAAAAVTVVAHGSRRTARGGQLRSKPKALPFKAQSTKSPVCSGTRTARREPYATAAGTAVPSMEFRTRFFDRHIACGGPFAELCSSTKKLTKASKG